VSDQKNAAPAGVPMQKIVTELKVSANLMTLDAGLFCIFNAPGSVLPDANTGLPGVRVSVPTGPVFRPDAVTIISFREDGWLGGWNGAALVRVTRGPAQILVTIYQAPNTTADPPRLQILRLAESSALPPVGGRPAAGAAAAVQALAPPPPPAPAMPPALTSQPAPGAAGAPAQPAGPVSLPQNTPAAAVQSDAGAAKDAEIVAHIQGRGDVMTSLSSWMGEPGSKKWVEGFAVSPKGAVGPGDIEYQAVLGRGWLSPWAEGGQYCGSRGMSLPILGLRMRLRGEAAERFDCIVTASFVDGTQVGPLDNGEPCQAESMAPLEAFNIKLVSRQALAPAKPAPAPQVKKPAGRAPIPAKPVKKTAAPAPARKAPAAPVKPTKSKSAPVKPTKRKK